MRVLGGLKYGASLLAIAGAMAAVTSQAQAGGFAVREQSAYYQGMSFAGAGTGDTLSSMYWNSAAAAAAPGMNTETHVSVIFPDTEINATGGAALALFPGADRSTGDLADPALVPASYANYQLNDRLFIGLAINSGFGLVTKPDNTDWVGSPIAITSDIFTMNVNPTVAYKLTPELTVGVGVQVEYFEVRLTNGPGILPGGRQAELDDYGFGFTAGLNWTPREGTSIGIGYRSAIDFDLEGDYNAPGLFVGGASADLTQPEILTIGLRQSLTSRLDLTAGFEWTDWSELGVVPVRGTPEALTLNWEDGYFYSIGLEYKYSPATTFRAGVAYEESPLNDENRSLFLPDSDRIWLSVGATHKLTDRITIDLGYTHIFADDSSICREAPNEPCAPGGAPSFIEAEGEGSVDIISASFRYKWGDSEPELEPLK